MAEWSRPNFTSDRPVSPRLPIFRIYVPRGHTAVTLNRSQRSPICRALSFSARTFRSPLRSKIAYANPLFDIYRGLARALGLEPSYRRAQLWRDIKQRVHELVDTRQVTPLWIIDEAQNLPSEFFRDFPAFLNFAFDSRDLISVWLVGHPALAQTLDRAPYAALASRIQVRVHLKPVVERERFGRGRGCGNSRGTARAAPGRGNAGGDGEDADLVLSCKRLAVPP